MEDDAILGSVPILDAHYGNVWTNISVDLFDTLGVTAGDELQVTIRNYDEVLFEKRVRYVNSFGGVALEEPAIYINDILNVGIAINQGNFAGEFAVMPGPGSVVELRR
ncbi:MAG: SAM hydroxide adenosyltransferase [Pseudomonadota bacterium]